MLQTKKNKTPSTRFSNKYKIFKTKIFKTLKCKKNNNLTNKKYFNKISKPQINKVPKLLNFIIISDIIATKQPNQLFYNCKSIYHNTSIWPGINFLNIGKICSINTILSKSKNFYLGSIFNLEKIPYDIFISNIYNNNKVLFIKSAGVSGKKQKTKKNIKLVQIKLPSNKLYLFSKTTYCHIGKNNNFFNNKFIEGKWGLANNKTKVINVRGVAKNPVDHPNGGRTKAKQPEKTPWGLIAKLNK